MAAPLLDRLLGPVPDLPAPRGLDPDKRASVALWSSAVLMVVLVFRAGFPFLGSVNPDWILITESSFYGKLYWVFWGVVCYLIAPLLIVLCVFRESPARYGFRIHFTRKMLFFYLLLFAVMAPLLYNASRSAAFLEQYPLVKDLNGDPLRIWMWEGTRALRFICLEFFFRGFLLFSLEERFGRQHAIAVSTLPYGLIHFGKPFSEALGAVVAGGVLGLFALRSRSIAGGALVHIGVATAMDLLSLYRQGLL